MAIDPDVEMFINALDSRISALEMASGASVDLSEILSRLATLESMINVPVNPDSVTQSYEDGTTVVYNRVKE